MQLFKKIIFRGTLELISGLHIGDSKEGTDIGGVDSPVVRRKDNNEPYIPGSSLKGKMRSLLDIAHGESDTTRKPDNDVGALFGALGSNGRPSRIIVRDAYLTEESARKLQESEFTDMPFSEIKFENSIDRVKGTATNPRQIERVPAGSVFNIEFVINVITDNASEAKRLEEQYLKTFHTGLRLLQDDYLGGSGSRGYGQVKIKLQPAEFRTIDHYLHG